MWIEAEIFNGECNWWQFCFFVFLNWIVVDSFLANPQTGPLSLKSYFLFLRFFPAWRQRLYRRLSFAMLTWNGKFYFVFFVYSQLKVRSNRKLVKELGTQFRKTISHSALFFNTFKKVLFFQVLGSFAQVSCASTDTTLL